MLTRNKEFLHLLGHWQGIRNLSERMINDRYSKLAYLDQLCPELFDESPGGIKNTEQVLEWIREGEIDAILDFYNSQRSKVEHRKILLLEKQAKERNASIKKGTKHG